MKKGLWIVLAVLTVGAARGNIGGFCAAVDVRGNHAYVAAGQVLLAVDVTDPAYPVCSGSLALPQRIEDVLVDGTNLFAACGEAGVRRVDITEPAGMELAAAYDSSGYAYGLALEGGVLYLADGVSGLKVLDAGTLAETASYYTNGPAMDVVVEGSAVFLLDHFNGIIALDNALNETGGYGMIAFGRRLASDGTSLYITDGEGKVTQLSMTTLAFVTNQLAGIPVEGIAVEGGDVYVARGEAGVQVLGGAALSTPGAACGLKIDGGRLYVADGFGGLSIFNAAAKNLLGTYAHVSRSRAAAVYLNHAYLAAGNSGVKIFDLTDPGQPVWVSAVAMSNALDVAVSDGLLLVTDTFTGLEIYDLSAPASPALLGRYAAPSNTVFRRVAATGSTAYLVGGYTITKLDISNPASPAAVDSITSAGYVFDLDVCGTNLLLAGGDGLYILSDDLAPQAEEKLPGGIQTVSASGDYALAGWNYLDLSSPLTPVSITNFGPLVHAMQLSLLDGAMYASADDGGMLRLPLSPGDSDGDGLVDALEQLIIGADPDDRFVTLADVRPDGDFDADGQSNLHEQIAGTSPIDAGSVFALRDLERDGAGFAVSWYSVAGHAYTIHKSTNLVEGFYSLQSGITATDPINVYLDAESSDSAMYMITIDP